MPDGRGGEEGGEDVLSEVSVGHPMETVPDIGWREVDRIQRIAGIGHSETLAPFTDGEAVDVRLNDVLDSIGIGEGEPLCGEGRQRIGWGREGIG